MTEPSDPIHLVIAADAQYGPWAGIALASMLRANPGESFVFHVLSDGIKPRDRAKLATLARRARASLTIYDAMRLLDGQPALMGSHHLSRAAYARLFVGTLLPPEIHRVLYIDCDILCRAEIRPLWRLGDGLALIAAVPERIDSAERKAALGIPAQGHYFNSGVMLINLEAWRAQEIGARLLAFAVAHREKIRWLDQDAISAVLWQETEQLPPRWNQQLNQLTPPAAGALPGDAALIHFNGQHKPWQTRYRGPMAGLFRAAKAASPWKWHPPQLRVTTKLMKSLRKRLRGR
jgi:lipopolysaccharide biosynthesis glycosyltransferase